jgi:hypothetical protein
MHFQSNDLVHSILDKLLHGQPLVLPDPTSTTDSPLQNQILPDYPSVFNIPPVHDYLLHVRLNPHQSTEHQTLFTLCKINFNKLLIVYYRVDEDQFDDTACAVHMRVLHSLCYCKQVIQSGEVRIRERLII